MRSGAGPGRTREDHLDVAAQLLAALARARQARELAELVGASALSETDRSLPGVRRRRRAAAVQPAARAVPQPRGDPRAGLAALTVLPRRELTMLSDELYSRYARAGPAPDERGGP